MVLGGGHRHDSHRKARPIAHGGTMESHRDDLPWKLTSPTALLTLLLGAFMLFVSVSGATDPLGAAQGFGLPISSADAVPWLRVKAGRDLGIALALFGLVATRQRRAAGVFVLACTVMPVVDALTTWSYGASLALALSVHGSAAAFALVLAPALLLRSGLRSVATLRPGPGESDSSRPVAKGAHAA
ncbi:DUF4267 domain-containing protein [Sorangium sp. So ce315]|uniref:DUF4267 domain-containing protein n=1 Tax=Sorangium sp. So ce315 TaxID=3133299 RepID=UPI003F5EC7DF